MSEDAQPAADEMVAQDAAAGRATGCNDATTKMVLVPTTTERKALCYAVAFSAVVVGLIAASGLAALAVVL